MMKKANKEKVLVYGVGSGGENYLKNQIDYEVIYVSDGNSEKWGQVVYEKTVIPPDVIKEKLTAGEFSKVIIASMFYLEIKEELIRKYNISSNLIEGAPKRLIVRDAITFENPFKYEYAKKTLIYLLTKLNNYKINYYLDFGTLLGFKRDGDFIPWDDDIDLSISRKYISELLEFIKEIIPDMNEKINGDWHVDLIKDKDSKIVEIKLKPTAFINEACYVSVDFYIWDEKGNEAFNRINSANIKHFGGVECIGVFGINANVYHEVEEYLSTTYGEWKKPNPNMSFGEHNHKGRFNSTSLKQEINTRFI
ncbi:LicD family protein [Lysinibacillus xylanilyticus]|uniref:nucleoside-diphosphate sugar epimerase/dehydratase n=1 Tax=Lysinibacillus xylanilyticus TaxID=582475 RepID=UPI003D0507C2